MNNVLREYDEIRKEIKIRETSVEYIIENQWKRIASIAKNILLTKIQSYIKLNKTD